MNYVHLYGIEKYRIFVAVIMLSLALHGFAVNICHSNLLSQSPSSKCHTTIMGLMCIIHLYVFLIIFFLLFLCSITNICKAQNY